MAPAASSRASSRSSSSAKRVSEAARIAGKGEEGAAHDRFGGEGHDPGEHGGRGARREARKQGGAVDVGDPGGLAGEGVVGPGHRMGRRTTAVTASQAATASSAA